MFLPHDSSEIDLHYEAHDAGAPILFLHGFGGNLRSWRHLVTPLSGRYRLILLDLKGFGASPKPLDGKYSVEDHATLVHRFVCKHDLRNLTIVGHSLGGTIGPGDGSQAP